MDKKQSFNLLSEEIKKSTKIIGFIFFSIKYKATALPMKPEAPVTIIKL